MTEPQSNDNVGHSAIRLFAVNWAVYLAGMNDATTGALTPFLQSAYNIGLFPIALVYLINFAGFLVAAFTNVYLSSRIGMGGTLLFGALSQLFAYCLMFWKPPYPLFACAYFLSGLGVAYQDAQVNSMVANLPNSHRWLGVLHAVYGLGALVSPLVATTIATRTAYWHYYYLVLLGFAFVNVVLLAGSFWNGLGRPDLLSFKTGASESLKGALSQKAVWALSAFFFLYVGAEVTIGGWVVEFLISVRHGSQNQVGYIASGFWGGLTLGRVVLADVTHKFGERRMVFIYIAIGLVLHILFWVIPNIIADAVLVSLLGFVIAPFFPAGLSVLTRVVPRDQHLASIGFTATVGQAGSAAFPFLTGAVASKAGVRVLQPIVLALLAGMAVLWFFVPQAKAKEDPELSIPEVGSTTEELSAAEEKKSSSAV